MELILFGVAIIVVFVLIIFRVKTKGEPINFDYPYSKKEALFTPAERSFLGVLNQAVGDKAQIFGKVRVADVLTPKKGMSRSDWQRAFNKISAKHFDFILCDKQDLSIICAVELDDLSHQSKIRKERDEFLVGACSASSVPLIQVPAKSSYNISEIRVLLSSHLKGIHIEGFHKETYAERVSGEEVQQSDENGDKNCPKCSSKLVKRVAKKGKNVGQEFLACSSYPKCRHIEAGNA